MRFTAGGAGGGGYLERPAVPQTRSAILGGPVGLFLVEEPASGLQRRYGATLLAIRANSCSVRGIRRNAAHPSRGLRLVPAAASDPYNVRWTPTCRIRRTTRAALAGEMLRSTTVVTSNQRFF